MNVRLCLAALVFLVSCGSRGDKPFTEETSLRPLNVVLVTIDTLRPDRLGCYGYSKIETPNLDRFAKSGVLLENAVAQAPLTEPSHASMFTGTYPPVHKVRDTGGFVLQPFNTTLAEILQKRGWDTAAFVGASVLKKRFGFDQGFAHYDDDMGVNPERRAKEVVDRAIAWLGPQSGKPYFLWVHVFDPHFPYDPPTPFREAYRGRAYDGEVAYTDREIGRLFDAIARKSPPDKTIVAVLSDHGEAFSEHGEYAHGVFLYDTTLRIAFLMRGPGIPEGVRVRQQARSIDLLPTLLDLMGGKPPREAQGASLVPAFTGKEARTTYSYAETLFPKLNMGWAELRGIRTSRWKYIRAPKPELYDLASDPSETKNVIDAHPAAVKELESRLRAVAGNPDSEKIETAAADRRTMEQLRSLGYLGGSSGGQYTLTGKGTDPKDRLAVLKLLHTAVYSDSPLPLPHRVTMLREALGIDPANPALYSNLGDLYRKAGRLAEEAQLYQEAVNKGVRSAWLCSRLGALRLRQGNRPDAIAYLEKAARLNPSDYDSLQNLAVAYRETGRIADAKRILIILLDSEESYAPAYNEMGMVAFQEGDRSSARDYFEKAAQLDPIYHLNLARLYKISGDTAPARASFQLFLDAAASRAEYHDVIPQVKEELTSLRDIKN